MSSTLHGAFNRNILGLNLASISIHPNEGEGIHEYNEATKPHLLDGFRDR